MLKLPIEASFTPHSDYVLTGSSDGQVHVFSNISGQNHNSRSVADIQSNQSEAIINVEFNPKYLMMASASSSTSIWVPEQSDF